jgi:hypothetical protein
MPKKISDKLINYIKRYNVKARDYNEKNKGTGNFMGLMVENPKHWEESQIFDIRDLVRSNLINCIWDDYKSINGIRPRFMNFEKMSIRELRREINTLNK